jgi:hypothetical protein
MKHLRAIALMALMALPTMVVPAFGQQETDPTWYDPWAPVLVKPAMPPQTQTPVAKKEDKANTTIAQHKVKKSVHGQAPRQQPERVEAMLTTK